MRNGNSNGLRSGELRSPQTIDFHALRHTCGAWLAMNGAQPKGVQSVMRHSIITLTMDPYGHLFPGQEADTVASLPSMMGNEPAVLKATGTDDERHLSGERAQRYAQQLCSDLGLVGANGCDDEHNEL